MKWQREKERERESKKETGIARTALQRLEGFREAVAAPSKALAARPVASLKIHQRLSAASLGFVTEEFLLK